MKQLIFALLLVATFSTKLVSQTADPTKWTVVYNSINDKEGEIVQGSPAFSIGDYKRSYVLFRSLPKMNDKLNDVIKKLNQSTK